MRTAFLTILLLVTGCGGQVAVTGEVVVKHQVDLSTLDKYFERLCELENATNMEDCVLDKVVEFWSLVDGH